MKPVWTLEQITDNLGRWNAAWPTDAPVDYTYYTFPPAHHLPIAGFSAFSPAQRAALERVMQLVSDVVPLDFREVADNGQEPGPGNERIGFLNVNSNDYKFTGRARLDFTEPSGDTLGVIRGADVEINMHRAGPRGGWAIGDWNFSTLTHELLHTLGLNHAGDYNGDSGHAQDYESAAEYMQDSGQYTVMSYWAASATGADHVAGGKLHFAATPLVHDIAALQALYGANMTTRTGNTVYGFHANAGRASYDLGRDPHLVFAIWDAGGRDTLDLSGYATASRIDLAEGGFSGGGGMTDHIAIAHGAVIENAVGGAGNDLLLGNAAANRLDGGGGADRMAGGLGDDVYLVDHASDRALEGASGGGTDMVRSSAGFTLAAGLETLVLTGAAAAGTGNALANRILGNAAANLLAGERGADLLEGGGGNDRLFGGLGNDRLRGGAGEDLFYFDAALHRSLNVDRILDFAAADDTIRLDLDVFTGIAADGRLAAAAFRASAEAQDSTDRILYDAATGRIFYDADGSGEAAAILFARVAPGTELGAADFQAVI
ncbi:MAG TPA: M10 family metallopeptidase [Allosphingosinicella sp.]|nr:M10 family metallopeptidase [Allosphingosinicella sp.]